jgi:hypothetical protein
MLVVACEIGLKKGLVSNDMDLLVVTAGFPFGTPGEKKRSRLQYLFDRGGNRVCSITLTMISPFFFFVFSGAANIIRVIPGKHFRVLIVPI